MTGNSQMDERAIRIILMGYVLNEKNHVAAIPNSRSLVFGEADLLSVTPAGLVHEFEIKRTIGDYRADFRNKVTKHILLQQGSPAYSPNYFWFVTHGFEVEVPDYAGWMTIEETRWGTTIARRQKKAPRLHGGKWDDAKVAKIARLLSFRLLKEYDDQSGA